MSKISYQDHVSHFPSKTEVNDWFDGKITIVKMPNEKLTDPELHV